MITLHFIRDEKPLIWGLANYKQNGYAKILGTIADDLIIKFLPYKAFTVDVGPSIVGNYTRYNIMIEFEDAAQEAEFIMKYHAGMEINELY